jgi:hypothetical protein
MPEHERAAPARSLGFHPHAIRPQPRAVHAAPPRRPRRSGRPHQLVHRPTRPRRDHRRGRRRQDRRRARRHRRPGHLPARRDLPAQPLRRGPRHAAPHRLHARAGAALLHRHPRPASRRRPGSRTRRTRPHPDRDLRHYRPRDTLFVSFVLRDFGDVPWLFTDLCRDVRHVRAKETGWHGEW